MKALTVLVDSYGRILLPAKVRETLGLRQGSELTVHLRKEGLLLKTRAQAWQRAQEHFSRLRSKGVLWSEEIIQERRKEARRERMS